MSKLLDRGREILYIFPEVAMKDSRGDVKKIPSEEPVILRVTTTKDRSQIADLPGQVDVHVLRVITRSIPQGDQGRPSTWARIIYQGQEYDLAEPPRFSAGPSRASAHWEFSIRSRANLAPLSTPEQRQHTLDGPDAYGPVGGGDYPNHPLD